MRWPLGSSDTGTAAAPGTPERVYVASAFRGDVPENVARASATCTALLLAGHAPFASHVLYTGLLDDGDAAQGELGLAAGLAWLQAADAIHVHGQVERR